MKNSSQTTNYNAQTKITNPDHKPDFRLAHIVNIQRIITRVLEIGSGCIIYHWKALNVSYNISKIHRITLPFGWSKPVRHMTTRNGYVNNFEIQSLLPIAFMVCNALAFMG